MPSGANMEKFRPNPLPPIGSRIRSAPRPWVTSSTRPTKSAASKSAVQFALERKTGGLNLGDVKDLAVSSAGKAGAKGLPHQQSRAIAPGEVACLAVLFLPIWYPWAGDPVALTRETYHFHSSFHPDRSYSSRPAGIRGRSTECVGATRMARAISYRHGRHG
jgi:hypothetical protein